MKTDLQIARESLTEEDIDYIRRMSIKDDGPEPANPWRPISTLPTRKGTHILVEDRRFGVGEAMLFDDGNWGLASFNGQILRAEIVVWMPMPAPPQSSATTVQEKINDDV